LPDVHFQLSSSFQGIRPSQLHFVTSLFSRWGAVSAPHNPQAAEPLFASTLLPIQYIRFAGAVSSMSNPKMRRAVVKRAVSLQSILILSYYLLVCNTGQ